MKARGRRRGNQVPPVRALEPFSHRLAGVFGLQEAGRVLRDFATYFPTRAIPALVGFLVLPVLARKLFPTELGVLAIAQTLITLGWVIVASWLANAVIRELEGARARGDVAGFRRTLARAVGLTPIALAAYAGLLAVGGIFSSAIGDNLVLIVAATGGLAVQNIAVSLFAASLRPRAYALVEVSARVGGIGVGAALVFAGHRVSGYLLGLALSSITIGLVGLWAAWPRSKLPQPVHAEPPQLGRWLRYGVPASLAAIVMWTLDFVDRYILALLKDTGAVGVYTVGNVLGDRVVMVPMLAFTTAAAPLLVRAFERQGREEVERLMRAYTRIVLIVGFPCIAFVAAVGGEIVTMVTGFRYNDYRSAAAVAPLVAVGSLLTALAVLANTGLAVARQTKYLVFSAGLGLAANVVANLVLIPPLGIKGAAIATPIGTGLYLAFAYMWARPYARWRFPYPTAIRAAAAAGAGYAAAVLLTPDTFSRPATVSAAAGIGGAVYLAAMLLLGERRGSERLVAAGSAPIGEEAASPAE